MLANWTKATTTITTPTAGTITLAAVSGFPKPSQAFTTGEYVQYSIVTSDGNMEAGIGKIAASDTLERTKVFSTYNGTTYNNLTASALTLASGTHDVFITHVAESSFEPLHFPLSGPTDGHVFQTNLDDGGANVGGVASERITAWPYRLECSGIITGFGVYCSVAGAGSSVLVGLYEPNSNGRPGRLVAKTSSALDTTTTGWKSQTATANARVIPGWYYAAITVVAGTNPNFTGAGCLGTPFTKAGTTSTMLHMVYENVSCTTMPDPFPSTSLVYTSDSSKNAPLIGLALT